MKHKSRTAPSSGVSWLEPTDSEIYLFSFSLRCQEPLTDAADSVSRSAAEHPQVSVAERWWKMFQTIQEQRKRLNPDPLKPCTHDNHSSFIKVYILIFFVCLRARHWKSISIQNYLQVPQQIHKQSEDYKFTIQTLLNLLFIEKSCPALI